MISPLLPALVATLLLALVALVARLVVWLPPRRLQPLLPWMQALTVGLLLGDALLHMLPEAIGRAVLAPRAIGLWLALGCLLLLLVEAGVRSLRSGTATFARMDILADFIHHLVDGVVIGASFAVDIQLGVVVSLAIFGHELPREAANAGVLVAGGYSPRQAFLWSLLTTVGLPLGALLILLLGHAPDTVARQLMLAAGCTVYLALADVLPGLWSRLQGRTMLLPAIGVAAGLAFMAAMAQWEHHAH